MKIDVSKLSYTKATSFNEEVSFDKEVFPYQFPLQDILSCKVDVKATRYDDFINVHVSLKAKVILISAYTLKPFEYFIKDEDELNFVSSLPEYDEDDFILYKGNMINMDEHLFNLLSANIPLKPIKEGEFPPKSGESFIITSDEKEEENRKNSGNNKFSKLDEIEFD